MFVWPKKCLKQSAVLTRTVHSLPK
uniref:Uncharacterized protein n=1 Tax=Anguilla anguilla TaxID=7936 RepID=A0A0E9S3P4_ANGAN